MTSKQDAGPTLSVGYWRDPEDPNTAEYPDPHDRVDPNWPEHERLAVARYLREGREYRACLGYSWCRFGCGSSDMGSRDLADDVYVWPEGFAHYLEQHDVKPPEGFLEHVRQRLREQGH